MKSELRTAIKQNLEGEGVESSAEQKVPSPPPLGEEARVYPGPVLMKGARRYARFKVPEAMGAQAVFVMRGGGLGKLGGTVRDGKR